MDPERLKNKLSEGMVQCVLATPFRKSDEEVDFDALRENVRFFVDKCEGKPLALTPCGSTSEFYSMSPEERQKVIKTVVDEANGRLLVVAGASHCGTKRTSYMCKMAEDLGADGVMVSPPYYNMPNEQAMYQHYKSICESIGIGVVIYNFGLHCYIKPHLMGRIAEIPGIVGIKENTTKLETFRSHMQLAGKKTPILSGRGEFDFALIGAPLGASGFTSTLLANFAPEISLEILELAKKRENKKMWSTVEKRYLPLHEFTENLRAAYGPACTETGGPYLFIRYSVIKTAMDFVGLRGGIARRPTLNITEDEKQELRRILTKMGMKRI